MLRFGFTCCISIKKEEVSYFPKMYKIKLSQKPDRNVYIVYKCLYIHAVAAARIDLGQVFFM